MSKILLSFDTEEFDIPEEYGQQVPEEEKLAVSLNGLNTVLALLEKYSVKATFYTTAFFAEKNPELVNSMSEVHEIASHGYYHSRFKDEDVSESKKVLDKISVK